MVWTLVPSATIHGTRDASWLAVHKRRRRSRAALARRANERAPFMMPSPRSCQPPPCPPRERGRGIGCPLLLEDRDDAILPGFKGRDDRGVELATGLALDHLGRLRSRQGLPIRTV